MEPIDTEMTAHGWRIQTVVLAGGMFAVGTDAFVIVGLLPQIGRSLDVGVGAAGQLVSVFTLVYAVASPMLAAATGRWPRRRVLVLGLATLALGNAVTALAGDFALVLASRVLAGAGAGMFAAGAVAAAAYVAPDDRRGSSISTVTAGSTLSLVFGAPLGTLVGHLWGWQSALWGVAALAAVVAVTLALRLPAIPVDESLGLRQRLAPVTDRRVLGILVVTLLAFVAIFLPFTYMGAVFAPATGGSQPRLAALLWAFGVAATLGNLTAGRLADRIGGRPVVIGAMLLLAATCLLMLPARHTFAVAVVVVAISGLASFSVIGPQQHRIVALAPAAGASVVTALNLSTAYLGNFGSSVLGGLLLATTGSTALLVVAAVVATTCGALAWRLRAETRRDTRVPAA